VRKLALVVVAFTAGCPVGLPGLVVEFSANPTLVGPNEPFTLTWQTLNTKSCSVVGDSAPADHATNGSATVKLANVGPHKYTLQCLANDGTQVQSAPVVVEVNAADVHVKSDTDVKNLSGATEIKGSLVFDPGCSITSLAPLAQLTKIGGDLDYQCAGIANLTLPALAHVGGNVVIHGGDPTMTELHFDALIDTGADFSIKDLPKLKKASSNALSNIGQDLVVSSFDYPSYPTVFPNEANGDCTTDQKPRTLPSFEELDLPKLATVGRELTSEDATSLKALSLPALTSIGAAAIITGLGNNTTTTIAFPQLTSAGTILILGNPTLTSVTMPALTTTTKDPAVDNYAEFPTPDPRDPLLHLYEDFISDISCGDVGIVPAPATGDVFFADNGPAGADNSSVKTLDISALTVVGGTVWLTDLPESTIALPALSSARGLLVQNDAALTTISLPSLTALGSDPTQLDTLAALTSIDLPSLGPSPTGVLFLNPASTKLTSINLGSLTEIDQLEIDDVGAADLSQIGVVQVDTKLTIGAQFTGTSLAGLESLALVKGDLDLAGSALTSVNGLDNLAGVDGELLFDSGLTIVTINGFPKLTSVGSVRVFNDKTAHITLPALTTITGANGEAVTFEADANDGLVSVSLPALTAMTGTISIEGVLVTGVSFPALRTISGDLFLSSTAITDVDGFCALTHVVNLTLIDNKLLTNLGGFAQTKVAGALQINSNLNPPGQPLVPQCQIEQFFDQSGAATATFDFTESASNPRCALPSTCGLAGEGEGEGEGAVGEGEGEGAAGEGEGEGAAGEGEGEGAAGEGEGEGAAGEGEGEGQ
jgi:hypothetical protein